MRVFTAPLSDQVIDDELGIPVETNEDELTPNFCIIFAGKDVLVFFETVRPQFIDGQLTGPNVSQFGIEQLSATFTGQREQIQNGFLIYPDDTRGCANARALDQVVNDLDCGFHFNPHLAKILFLGFRKRAIALSAAIALNSLASVLPKLFHFNRTIVARHFEPCLSSATGSQWRCRGSCEQLRE